MAGATITIKLEALTEEANQALQKFFTNTNAGLNKLPGGAKEGHEALTKLKETSTLAKESLHGMEATVLLLGGEHFPMLARGVLAARMGLMTLRSTVKLTGAELGTVVPILGALGVVAAAGALVWKGYADRQAEAKKRTEEFAETLKELPKVVGDVKTLVESKLVSPGTATSWLQRIGALPVSPSSLQSSFKFDPNALRGVNLGAGAPVAPAFLAGSPGPLPGFVSPSGMKSLQEDLAKQGFLIKGGTPEKPTFEISPQIEALAQLRELQKKVVEEGASGFDKEKVKAKAAYEEAIQMVEKLAAVAGHFFSGSEADKLKAELEANYKAAITGIDFQAAEEMQKKAHESAMAGVEERAKQSKERLDELERQITLNQAKEGEKRGQNYEKEFQQRMRLIEQLSFEGLLTEKEYTAAVEQATIKRLEARQAEAEREVRLQESQQALELARIQGRRSLIEQDPNVTEVQKREELLGIYREENELLAKNIAMMEARTKDPALSDEARLEAERRYVELLQQHAELQLKIETTAAAGTWSGEFKRVLIDLQNQFGTWAGQMAHSFATVFESATHSISSNIAEVINRTKTWGQALKDIRRTIGEEMIRSIVQMGVQFVATQVLMRGAMLITAAVMRAMGAEQAAQNLTTFTTGAIAGIGTSGSQGGWVGILIYLGVLAAAIAAVTAMSGGFAEGGWVSGPGGPKSDSIFARLSNGEFVVPAEKARAYAPILNAIHNGTLDVGGVGLGAPHAASLGGGGGGGSVVNHRTDVQIAQFGGEAAAERWARSQSGEVFFHDMMKQHAYKYQKKG